MKNQSRINEIMKGEFNEMESIIGDNMQSIVNLFLFNPIELQDGWDMVLHPMEFKNIGDCLPIDYCDGDNSIIVCEFYVGDADHIQLDEESIESLEELLQVRKKINLVKNNESKSIIINIKLLEDKQIQNILNIL